MIFFTEGQNNIKSLGQNFKTQYLGVDVPALTPRAYSTRPLTEYMYNRDIISKLTPAELTLTDVSQILVNDSRVLKNNLANIFLVRIGTALATVGAIWNEGWHMVLLPDDKVGWSAGGLIFN